MSNKKKIDKEATVRNIREAAGENIKDITRFNQLMENEEDILDAALLWDAEVVYC
jgi:hypothetical protein